MAPGVGRGHTAGQGPDSDGGLPGANACSFSAFQTRDEERGRGWGLGEGSGPQRQEESVSRGPETPDAGRALCRARRQARALRACV